MIQPVKDRETIVRGIDWDMLRIDQIHPVVSGNKWFKLAPYLEMARQGGYSGLLSFGGAWSNHLHALAYAAREAGLASMGIVRGEEPPSLSPTLADARQWGMELVFIPRSQYAFLSNLVGHGWDEGEPPFHDGASFRDIFSDQLGTEMPSFENLLPIPAGGYGFPGMKGAAGIWEYIPRGVYTHILCAVGTGTMYAGLLWGKNISAGLETDKTVTEESIGPGLRESADVNDRLPATAQRSTTAPGNLPITSSLPPEIIGIPVLKNEGTLESEISHLLDPVLPGYPIRLDHRFHGGGYAKTSADQLSLMQSLYQTSGIPTDVVYTSKLMYAIRSMIMEGYFPVGSRVLAIHSGGLQGNRSLKKGILPF